MKTLIAILSTAFLFSSCGTEDTTSKDDEQRKQDQEAYQNYVPPKPTDEPTEEDDVVYYIELPDCNNRKAEKLVYIIEERDFLVCRQGKWIFLPLEEKEQMYNSTTEE